MRWDSVFLDIDGTLIDSNGGHAQAWSDAARAHGYNLDPAFFAPLIGMGGNFVLEKIDAQELRPGSEKADAVVATRKEILNERYLPHFKPLPGARALVERCTYEGMRVVIATSGEKSELETIIDVLNIGRYLHDIVCASDIATAKPAPDVVSVALQKAHVSPDRAVMIGDTKYDIESAARNNVQTIALRCGGNPDEDFQDAIGIYDSPADLLVHFDAVFDRNVTA